jgi:hypothetical protein
LSSNAVAVEAVEDIVEAREKGLFVVDDEVYNRCFLLFERIRAKADADDDDDDDDLILPLLPADDSRKGR